MNTENVRAAIGRQLDKDNGILRLYPCWVLRDNLPPGRRLKINIHDLYPYGLQVGAVCERWIASTGKADNGAKTLPNEGLSRIAMDDGTELLLADAVEAAGDLILGSETMETFGGMKAFAKFYDFSIPIPHHVHLMEKDSRLVGVAPKPEAYYFPEQLNAINYGYMHTYFGLQPGTTKQDLIRCLETWGKFDGADILQLSTAYRLKVGTGWDVPAGILHAPGSMVTYEPQYVSDTSLFFQSIVEDWAVDRKSLTKFLPKERENDLEYIVNVLDWEANTDPDFRKKHYREPIFVEEEMAMREKGYLEKWVTYGAEQFSAKELTVLPGRSVEIRDAASYGLIMMDGTGTINGVKAVTPASIRYGQLADDEFYVTKDAAMRGVRIVNESEHVPMVMLKNFGPDNTEALALKQRLGL